MKVLVAAGVALALATPAGAQTAKTPAATYRLTVAGQAVPNGAVWLYYYGYGYLQYSLISGIKNGQARIRVSAELVDAEIRQIDSAGPSFIIAVETPSGWYRSADFADLNGATAALESLGQAGSKSSHAIDLAAPVRQHVRVLNPDGTPRPDVRLLLSTYVSQGNHCARHMGFYGDAIELRSDRNGLAAFDAPLADRFLAISFYSRVELPYGDGLVAQEGVVLKAGREHVLQHVWDRAPERPFRIRVIDAEGKPMHASLLQREATDGCSAGAQEFESAGDEQVIMATFALEHTGELIIYNGDEETPDNELSDDERAELNRRGELTIRWPRPKRPRG